MTKISTKSSTSFCIEFLHIQKGCMQDTFTRALTDRPKGLYEQPLCQARDDRVTCIQAKGLHRLYRPEKS